MAIKFWCARCGRPYTTARDNLGRKARCRACGYVQIVPGSAESPPAPAEDDPLVAAAPEPRILRPAPVVVRRPNRSKSESWTQLLRSTALGDGRLQGYSLCLLACSVADLFMTITLLRQHPGAYESNPAAQWFYARWNLAGMVFYKFGLIGFVIALSELIERRRPGWGKFILILGSAGALYAFTKGYRILGGFNTPPADGD